MAFWMYLSIVLGLLLFWLITMAMPFWQWFVWPQYTQIGFVSLTSTLYTGVKASVPVTGTKPECRPGRVADVKLLARGLHGSAKLDSLTVWFWSQGLGQA